MSLRSGFNNFLNNARQWGLRTGTNVRNFYTQAREIAHKVQPHLNRGTQFVENMNTQVQRGLNNQGQRETIDTWTRKLRKFTDDYNKGLDKADRVHDVITS